MNWTVDGGFKGGLWWHPGAGGGFACITCTGTEFRNIRGHVSKGIAASSGNGKNGLGKVETAAILQKNVPRQQFVMSLIRRNKDAF